MNACLIFDLDDTLIDTKGVLLPAALARVEQATGIPAGRLNARGKRIDEVVAGLDLDPERYEAAARAWYDPEVPDLDPLPGAERLLAALHGRAHVFLLTRGDPARQNEKVRRCGLARHFEGIVIRPIEEPGSKRDDIETILRRCGLAPDRCAVIGDDERDELEHAKALGCLAIKVPDTPLTHIEQVLADAGLLAADS
ncbi:MAG: HAD family hydrolase [Planctomycetota bacterium]|jgi:putative hydrolase of the HAD superfamily